MLPSPPNILSASRIESVFDFNASVTEFVFSNNVENARSKSSLGLLKSSLRVFQHLIEIDAELRNYLFEKHISEEDYADLQSKVEYLVGSWLNSSVLVLKVVSLEKLEVEVAIIEQLKTAISEVRAFTDLPAGDYEMSQELERLQSIALTQAKNDETEPFVP